LTQGGTERWSRGGEGKTPTKRGGGKGMQEESEIHYLRISEVSATGHYNERRRGPTYLERNGSGTNWRLKIRKEGSMSCSGDGTMIEEDWDETRQGRVQWKKREENQVGSENRMKKGTGS